MGLPFDRPWSRARRSKWGSNVSRPVAGFAADRLCYCRRLRSPKRRITSTLSRRIRRTGMFSKRRIGAGALVHQAAVSSAYVLSLRPTRTLEPFLIVPQSTANSDRSCGSLLGNSQASHSLIRLLAVGTLGSCLKSRLLHARVRVHVIKCRLDWTFSLAQFESIPDAHKTLRNVEGTICKIVFWEPTSYFEKYRLGARELHRNRESPAHAPDHFLIGDFTEVAFKSVA
jgi:hypothetical protein